MYNTRVDQSQPVDLTGLSDDEIHYAGECLLEDLEAILVKYKPYFITQPFYQTLQGIHKIIQRKLEEEERIVE